jgi:acyl-coenzyme A thioesterase PaaI-like protein
MEVPQLKTIDPAKNLCFGCSQNNPVGLKLQFTEDKGIIKGEFVPGKFHQGWPGFTHGGILFTILDEACGYVIHNLGIRCVTAKSEIRFFQMVPIDEPIQVTAQVTKNGARLIETEATLCLKDGTSIARSTSLWYVVKGKSKK